MNFPLNAWYAAAYDVEVRHALLPRTICNQKLVLFRRTDGAVAALEDACWHRLMPLSLGRLEGDELVCGYHGLVYDSQGRCTHMPSQETLNPSACVRSFPVVERHRFVWIWPGDPAKADESLIPTAEEIGLEIEGLYAKPFYAHHVEGRYQLLNDNLLDLTHLGYLHSSSIGTPDDAATVEERNVNERRISSRRIMRNTPAPPVSQHRFKFDGPVDRVSGMDFFFPGFHSGIGDTYVAQGHERAGEMLNSSRVWHAVTPAKKFTTNYFFAMGSPDREGVEFMVEYLKPVLEEDIFATVEIEKIIQTLDELPQELMLKSDGTAVLGRRKLQQMMDLEKLAEAAE